MSVELYRLYQAAEAGAIKMRGRAIGLIDAYEGFEPCCGLARSWAPSSTSEHPPDWSEEFISEQPEDVQNVIRKRLESEAGPNGSPFTRPSPE